MVGISMAAFYFFLFAFNYFTLQNVSKEYTLKKNFDLSLAIESNGIEYAGETTPLRPRESDTLSFNQKYIISLKALFRNKHILFILAMVILQTYARGFLKLIIPIKGEEYFN